MNTDKSNNLIKKHAAHRFLTRGKIEMRLCVIRKKIMLTLSDIFCLNDLRI